MKKLNVFSKIFDYTGYIYEYEIQPTPDILKY